MQAWHFLPEDKRLGYGDGRAVEVGVQLECEGEPELCRNGMHGSVRLIDALHYASGSVICRVEIEGDVIEGNDKICGRRRTVLWWLDATRILHEFACQIAEDALSLVDNPDPRSVAAIAAKHRWLNGEITGDELAVASEAASEAARSAAWSAARSAAWSAASAASAAALEAARDATRASAWAAADAAADDAAGDAARNAAWNAAWNAARAQQDARLTEMVMAAHEANEMVQEDE